MKSYAEVKIACYAANLTKLIHIITEEEIAAGTRVGQKFWQVVWHLCNFWLNALYVLIHIILFISNAAFTICCSEYDTYLAHNVSRHSTSYTYTQTYEEILKCYMSEEKTVAWALEVQD